MKTEAFEQEIKKLDDGFSIVPNPNRQGLSNIFYQGRNYDLPVVSSYEIPEEVDEGKRYEFPNGMSVRLWSTREVMTRLEKFIKDFKEQKYDDLY